LYIGKLSVKFELQLQGVWTTTGSTECGSCYWPWRWYFTSRFWTTAEYVFHKWWVDFI